MYILLYTHDAYCTCSDEPFHIYIYNACTQICKQLGGTIDDSELVHGMVFEKGAKKSAGGPTRIENAKVMRVHKYIHIHTLTTAAVTGNGVIMGSVFCWFSWAAVFY